jgi:hypothetical protein
MINITTYHETTNYGALIQCLALKQYIEKKYKTNVSLCDYHPKELIFAEKYRPLITKNFSKLYQTLKKNYTIRKWKKNAFKENNYINDNKENTLNIYGSDEIWNFDNAYHGYDPYYFGKFDAEKKIAYAASIGRSNYLTLGQEMKSEITKLLQGFSKISVRDENTAEFVYQLTKIDPEIVLDPSLIYTPPILEDKKFLSYEIEQDYVLIYGTVFSKLQKELINNFCKKRNFKIISVGYYNKWIKENYLGLNPTTFYHFVKNSKYVFTSMFHGVMFSTKLSKQFYFSTDPIRENKIKSFINNLKLNDREILNNLCDQEIDYDEVNKKINKLKNSSRNFLINNINKVFNLNESIY